MNPKGTDEADDTQLPMFECTKCGACCREESILITVTSQDIGRISSALGLAADEMLRALDFYIVDENSPIPAGLQRIPAPVTERGPAFVALKKMENGECIFLKDNLCMIHAIRPIVCRSFPFTFRQSAEGQFWGLSAAKHICPGLGTGPRVLESDLQDLSNDVLQSLLAYSEFVAEWNKSSACTSKDLIRAIIPEARLSD